MSTAHLLLFPVAGRSQYLADHATAAMIADAKSGRLHVLVDRVHGWTEAASEVVAGMPEPLSRRLAPEGEEDVGDRP